MTEIEFPKDYIFENFQDAFYFCKKEDKPIIAKVNNKRWRIHPNGDAHPLSDKPTVTVNLVLQIDDVMDWRTFTVEDE